MSHELPDLTGPHDLHDLMRAAAEDAPRADGLAGSAHRIARRRLARRRSYAAGGTAVAVAAVATTFSVMPRGSGVASVVGSGAQSVSPAPSLAATSAAASTPGTAATTTTDASGSAPAVRASATAAPTPAATAAVAVPPLAVPSALDCSAGFAKAVSTASIAAEVGLLSSDARYHLQGPVLARQQREDCPSPAMPLLYESVADGVVTSSIALSGPEPQSGSAAVQGTYEAAVPATVRGTTGQWVPLSDTVGLFRWAEPDGTHWSLEGSGLSRAQLLAVVNGLTLTGTIAAAPDTLPAGLLQQPAVPAGSTTYHPIWYATYVRAGLSFDVMVQAVPGGVPSAMVGAAAGNRVSTVLGQPAQISGDGGISDGIDSLSWTLRPGVLAEVDGNHVTDAELEAFAATLTPASADDPRLVAKG